MFQRLVFCPTLMMNVSPASTQYASALFILHIDRFEMLWEKGKKIAAEF